MWIAAWSRDSIAMKKNNIFKGSVEETQEKCSGGSEIPVAAFRRSSLLMRSPPTGQTSCPIGNAREASQSVLGRAEILASAPPIVKDSQGGTRGKNASSGGNGPAGDCGDSGPTDTTAPISEKAAAASKEEATAKEGSPRLELIQKMRRMEEEAISQCRTVLAGMQRATDRQKNISIDVKTGISKLAELLDVVMNHRRSWKTAEGERAFSQLRRNAATLQMAEVLTPKSSVPKRSATSPVAPMSSKRTKGKAPSAVEKDAVTRREEVWQTVTSKREKQRKRKPKKSADKVKRKDRPRSRPEKPEAVIVRPAEGRSYADVLRNLRAKMVADDSVKIRSVRRTMTGAILMECGRGGKIAPDFVNLLRDTVRDAATVAELRPTTTVVIRDLDSLTGKEEVEAAVRKVLMNKEEPMRIRTTLPDSREQVRAYITLSTECAKKLVEIGDVKIGFIRAKVRVSEVTRRCYRCLGTGHLQSNCTGPDRRNVCIRCGETGHKMNECKAAPKCVLCLEEKRARYDHLAGSRRCPTLQK